MVAGGGYLIWTREKSWSTGIFHITPGKGARDCDLGPYLPLFVKLGLERKEVERK